MLKTTAPRPPQEEFFWQCAPAAMSVTFVVALVSFFLTVTPPAWKEGFYVLSSGETSSFLPPLSTTTPENRDIDITLPFTLSALHPSVYSFTADDCLQSLEVNGQPVIHPSLPFCNLGRSLDVSLKDYLHAGENTLRARVHNNGGPAAFTARVSPQDPIVLGESIAVLLCIIVGLIAFAPRGWKRLIRQPTAWVFASGVLLRMFYVLRTPYGIRGHDTDAHIEYIRYVATHWTLPPVDGGWEFWQPPLYYIFSSVWLRLGDALSWTQETALFAVQLQSLALSIAVLGMSAWIGRHLFRRPEEQPQRMFFLAFLAFFPGLVFFASRINNDVLLHALAFLFFALLLRWWERPSTGVWIAAIIAAGLAVLTKNNGMLLLPIAAAAIVCRPHMNMRSRLTATAVAIAVFVGVTGWVVPLRWKNGSSQNLVVGNIGSLNSGLMLRTDIGNSLVFNPLGVLSHPYNNAWNDLQRRQYFWEYLFRSAWFGEFDFGERLRTIAVWILLLAMALLSIGCVGLIAALQESWRKHFPSAVTLMVLLAGHAAARGLHPFSSMQDFRYSPLLAVPVTFFVLSGMRLLPQAPRKLAAIGLQSLLMLCVIFLLSL